jgi:hypothetical protein
MKRDRLYFRAKFDLVQYIAAVPSCQPSVFYKVMIRTAAKAVIVVFLLIITSILPLTHLLANYRCNKQQLPPHHQDEDCSTSCSGLTRMLTNRVSHVAITSSILNNMEASSVADFV